MNTDTYVELPYGTEIRQIDDVYERAMQFDVSEFARWLRTQSNKPALMIGAGGSLSVAQLASQLHEHATGRLARAGAPLDFFQTRLSQDSMGLLFTASGGHSDSLAIANLLKDAGSNWGVFCGRVGSQSELILGDAGVEFFAFELLPEVFSWVSVSALLGQAVVIARAYSEAFPDKVGTLPPRLADLLPGGASTVDEAIGVLEKMTEKVLARPSLAFLFGTDTAAAAVDFDSKFTESALGRLVMSEYRNFAHGRFQSQLLDWKEWGILGFYSEQERALAEATLAVVPDSIPAVGVSIPGDGEVATGVASLLAVLLMIDVVGTVRDLTPGWGSRNTFGDEIYEFDLLQFFPSFRAGR